ncbi:hypothetical protein CBER1_11733 [Cercospora berteroae]|uniref:Tat pathway signal sequence n=1 Tax=Cercospora berteroae TaxID=357750 RepID=A0A2S6C0D5_9PEZI|nr:hypothetical protein CBER1_11733 [Cercospora berteroae]
MSHATSFSEKEALLQDEEQQNQDQGTNYRFRATSLHFMALYATVVLQFILLLWMFCSATKDPSQLIYSPAADAVEYQIVDFGKYFLRRNKYMAELGHLPTDETDKHWEDLYAFRASGIPEWQARKLDIQTLPLPDTDTYLVDLDVFHQLHCLDILRMALYPDRYKYWQYLPDGRVNIGVTDFHHWEHCVDGLRQAIMCHGDISPLQYRINGINGILAKDLATRHTCRNFEKLRDWAKQREVPWYEERVAEGLLQLKPNFTLQEAMDTEV